MTEQVNKAELTPETDRQAAELEAMRRMLAASRGTFSLSIAVCNSPALRDYLIEKLKTSDSAIEVTSIPEQTSDVYGTICEEASECARSALFLTNMEKSLPSSAEDHPVLRSLNATRELWKDKFPCPVVFWLPEYAVTLLSTHARDFWAWRSHQFDFVSEMATLAAGLEDRFSGDAALAENLAADQKRFRIAELQQRIAEAGDPPPRELAVHVSIWLNELGFLLRAIGALDQAEDMLRKALEIGKRLGRIESVASNYGNLGLIYQDRRDLDRAEEMHRKALEINERLGRFEGLAIQYSNLGLICLDRGDLDQAEQMLRKALETNERLAWLEGMARNCGNLGRVYNARGDLDQAEQMIRKGLGIYERLGQVEGIAVAYGNLGAIRKMRGDLEQARDYWTRARDLFDRIGIRSEVDKTQSLLDSLDQDYFQVKEAEKR